MAKISYAQIKKTLIAMEMAKANERLALQIDYERHPQLVRSQNAGEKIFTDILKNSGFDQRKYSELLKQRRIELDKAVEKQKAAALKQARRTKGDSLNLKDQLTSLKLLAENKPFFSFPSITLDTPFLIWATPQSNIISDSRAEPFNSWAKIKVDSNKSEGNHKLSFYYLWNNSSDFYTVINASTFMSATGHIKATAYGGLSGISPTTRYSNLFTTANLALWSWWLPHPTSTGYSSATFIPSLHAHASFWDDTKSSPISDGFSLSKTLFIVPPRGTVVFEVTFMVNYNNGHGRVVCDFESGDFKITCPVLVVSLLTSSTAPIL